MIFQHFCGLVDIQTTESCTARRDHHQQSPHRDFPTRQGGNKPWIAETEIHSATTTTDHC